MTYFSIVIGWLLCCLIALLKSCNSTVEKCTYSKDCFLLLDWLNNSESQTNFFSHWNPNSFPHWSRLTFRNYKRMLRKNNNKIASTVFSVNVLTVWPHNEAFWSYRGYKSYRGYRAISRQSWTVQSRKIWKTQSILLLTKCNSWAF